MRFYIKSDVSRELLLCVDNELSHYCCFQKTIEPKYILYESYLINDTENIVRFHSIIKNYLEKYIIKTESTIPNYP
jgi:hypothetical protein